MSLFFILIKEIGRGKAGKNFVLDTSSDEDSNSETQPSSLKFNPSGGELLLIFLAYIYIYI